MPIITPGNTITEPFGTSAADITLPIPIADPGGGNASFTLGFPHANKLPIGSGGIPPFIESMNGILYMVSDYAAFLGAGQIFQYNAAFAGTIGGYALGAIVAMVNGAGFWQNTTANNTTDPDVGGPGWIPIYTYGAATIAVVTGTVTLTAPQAACETIIFTGTLTGNVTIIVPANWKKRWTFVNACAPSGFTITIKYATGTGAVIQQPDATNPQSVPTGVRGDGTNVYTEFAPLVSPQFYGRPTANTQAPHDSSNAIATTSYVDGADALKANLASPPLTGVPTAPTAAVGTNTTQLATTAFAYGTVTTNVNGTCVTLPNGYKLQTGTANPAGGTANITFPVPFTVLASISPNAISMAGAGVQTWLPSAPTLTTMQVANSGGSSYWQAEGF